MLTNINQIHSGDQEQSEDVERFSVFRFPHSLGNEIKRRIKSLGCTWNVLQHGWLCPIAKQEDVKSVLQEVKLHYQIQILSLPKGMIPIDPKIAAHQTRLEILEEQFNAESMQLLHDVYQYNASLRPEDFANAPSEDGISPSQLQVEKCFHNRWIALEGTKKAIEQAQENLSHSSTNQNDKVVDPKAPFTIAEALIQKHFLSSEQRTLQYCLDTFWRWDGTIFKELKEGEMRKIIYNFLQDAQVLSDSGYLERFNPNKFKVDQIVDALKAICHQNYHPTGGAIWLDDRMEPNPKYLISFRNGLLNMEAWLADCTTPLIPHTPLLLNVNSLNFEFDPHAHDPQEWLKFLSTIWPEDLESQQTLQEWIGYLLIQDTRLHKILLIVGPPRSGKGTIGRILRELLGEFNVVGPTLSSLGGEFGLQPFLNKMLATISDARLNGRGTNSLIIERLLSISGEDPLTINRKFLSPLTVQLSTRIIIMSNELPDMRDSSGALAKRYIVLTLQKSWYGQEDIDLLSRLQKELPGILLWALRGLARLQQRGRFLQPASAAQTVEELEAITSPIRAFVLERCKIKPQSVVLVDDLFAAWRYWCSLTGYSHASNVQSFGKNLRAAFPEVEMIRPQENLARPRYYKGISLAPVQDPSADVLGPEWEELDFERG